MRILIAVFLLALAYVASADAGWQYVPNHFNAGMPPFHDNMPIFPVPAPAVCRLPVQVVPICQIPPGWVPIRHYWLRDSCGEWHSLTDWSAPQTHCGVMIVRY